MFGKILKGVGKAASTAVKIAAPEAIAAIEPGTMVNTFAAGVIKHTPVIKNNNVIPYLNMLVSTGAALWKNMSIYGDFQTALVPSLTEGLTLAGGSTLLHQSIKLPMREAVKNPLLAGTVGPGEKFSI